MSNYLLSGEIRVFPSVGRSNGYDVESQLTNENNLSQILRSLCRERKSFVITKELSTNDFEFVIYGFYFKVLDGNDSLINKLGLGNTLWAGIRLDKQVEGDNNSSHYQLLQLANSDAIEDNLHDLDVDGNFKGIVFGTSEEDVRSKFKESDYIHTLHLLQEGEVPARSLLHSNTTEILDGDGSDKTANYISDKFTTKDLIANTLTTSSNAFIGGTLTVTGETILNSNLTANGHTITASTFVGSLKGNADTASNFNSSRTFTFSGGDISGSATSKTGGYTITASIIDSHVTANKIKDANVTTPKIKDAAITNSKIEDSAVTNDKIADGTIKTEKLGFSLGMELSVDGDDENYQILTINIPTLNNK